MWRSYEERDTVMDSETRAAGLYTYENAVVWLMARLTDLADAGIMDEIARTNPSYLKRNKVLTVGRAQGEEGPGKPVDQQQTDSAS